MGSEIYGITRWITVTLVLSLRITLRRPGGRSSQQKSPYNVGVDCAILMNPQTWVASGHLGGFSDPLMDCKDCHERFRADKH